LERAQAAPGVRAAALSSVPPMYAVDSLDIVPAGYQSRRGEEMPNAL